MSPTFSILGEIRYGTLFQSRKQLAIQQYNFPNVISYDRVLGISVVITSFILNPLIYLHLHQISAHHKWNKVFTYDNRYLKESHSKIYTKVAYA